MICKYIILSRRGRSAPGRGIFKKENIKGATRGVYTYILRYIPRILFLIYIILYPTFFLFFFSFYPYRNT